MEICPHHLLLDLDDLIRLGPVRPLRASAPRAAARRGAVGRTCSAVWRTRLVSDHCAYTIEEKEPGWEDIFAAPLGCQVMQETVPLVLDEAVHRRGLALDAFVRFSSTNAARIIGLYPAKGTIRPDRRRPRPLRPRLRLGRRREEPAVLEEPVVALRRSALGRALRADDRARRDRLRGR